MKDIECYTVEALFHWLLDGPRVNLGRAPSNWTRWNARQCLSAGPDSCDHHCMVMGQNLLVAFVSDRATGFWPNKGRLVDLLGPLWVFLTFTSAGCPAIQRSARMNSGLANADSKVYGQRRINLDIGIKIPCLHNVCVCNMYCEGPTNHSNRTLSWSWWTANCTMYGLSDADFPFSIATFSRMGCSPCKDYQRFWLAPKHALKRKDLLETMRLSIRIYIHQYMSLFPIKRHGSNMAPRAWRPLRST